MQLPSCLTYQCKKKQRWNLREQQWLTCISNNQVWDRPVSDKCKIVLIIRKTQSLGGGELAKWLQHASSQPQSGILFIATSTTPLQLCNRARKHAILSGQLVQYMRILDCSHAGESSLSGAWRAASFKCHSLRRRRIDRRQRLSAPMCHGTIMFFKHWKRRFTQG